MQCLPSYEELVACGAISRNVHLPTYDEAFLYRGNTSRPSATTTTNSQLPTQLTRDGKLIFSITPLYDGSISIPEPISQPNMPQKPISLLKKEENVPLPPSEASTPNEDNKDDKMVKKKRKQSFRQKVGHFLKESFLDVPAISTRVHIYEPGSTNHRNKSEKIPVNEEQLHTIGEEILRLTNEYRASQNISRALNWSEELYWIGCEHSVSMGSGDVPFGHEGFEERVKSIPFTSYKSAENVFKCRGCPMDQLSKTVIEGWIKSPGHEANLVGDFDCCSISVCKGSDKYFYFTQLFGKH